MKSSLNQMLLTVFELESDCNYGPVKYDKSMVPLSRAAQWWHLSTIQYNLSHCLAVYQTCTRMFWINWSIVNAKGLVVHKWPYLDGMDYVLQHSLS